MKILVLNCNGMVGHVVSLFFQERGHEVTGYDEVQSEFTPSVSGSLYDTIGLTELINKYRYDAIINCSAIINQYAEEDKAAASYINTFLPHYLEKLTHDTSTVVVHRSTDCIFSGMRGQYGIDDLPDATSFYARSKALGEIINGKDITIRTSLIGPELVQNGSGLLNWFLSQSGNVNGFVNAIWTGLTTIEFARVIEKLLAIRVHGLFQCVPPNAISKYDLLLLFEKYFPGGRRVLRVNNTRSDKSLLPVLGDYDILFPNYETMINEMADWVRQHNNIYKNIQIGR